MDPIADVAEDQLVGVARGPESAPKRTFWLPKSIWMPKPLALDSWLSDRRSLRFEGDDASVKVTATLALVPRQSMISAKLRAGDLLLTSFISLSPTLSKLLGGGC